MKLLKISLKNSAANKLRMLAFAIVLSSSTFFVSCGDTEQPDETNTTNTQTENTTNNPAPPANTDDGKGVGPIKEVTIGADIDKALSEKGKTLFEAKCTACHNTDDTKKVGPGLAKVTERRKPEWIMNMILAPEKMVQEDPTAKELLATYLAPMANQSLTEEEARQILEFFRQNDKQ